MSSFHVNRESFISKMYSKSWDILRVSILAKLTAREAYCPRNFQPIKYNKLTHRQPTYTCEGLETVDWKNSYIPSNGDKWLILYRTFLKSMFLHTLNVIINFYFHAVFKACFIVRNYFRVQKISRIDSGRNYFSSPRIEYPEIIINLLLYLGNYRS